MLKGLKSLKEEKWSKVIKSLKSSGNSRGVLSTTQACTCYGAFL